MPLGVDCLNKYQTEEFKGTLMGTTNDKRIPSIAKK
jgi:hypothetical protein